MASFPFTRLPAELRSEIIRVAANPHWDHAGPHYSTAVTLCSVSFAVRHTAIRLLLKTVSLSSLTQLLAFTDALHLQHLHLQTSSRLHVSYTNLVHWIWFRDCWEPLPEQVSMIDYAALYNIMRSTKNLALDFNSLHILYHGLSSAGASPEKDWECGKVTFVGEHYRWSPLMMTREGTAFLSRITHLVLWIPPSDSWDSLHHGSSSGSDSRIPSWIQDVPFSSLTSLSHIAFPLIPLPTTTLPCTCADFVVFPMSILVYSTPSHTDSSSPFSPETFRKWALSDDPLTKGTVIDGFVMKWVVMRPEKCIVEWDWGQGECAGESIWARVDRALARRGLDGS